MTRPTARPAQPWPTRQLVPTVQAVFLPINVAAFIVLRTVPLTPGIFAAGAAGTGAGLLAGTYLRDRIPATLVRVGVLIIAAVGAAIILVRAFG